MKILRFSLVIPWIAVGVYIWFIPFSLVGNPILDSSYLRAAIQVITSLASFMGGLGTLGWAIGKARGER